MPSYTYIVTVNVNGQPGMVGFRTAANSERDARFAAISHYIAIAPYDEGKDLSATVTAFAPN